MLVKEAFGGQQWHSVTDAFFKLNIQYIIILIFIAKNLIHLQAAQQTCIEVCISRYIRHVSRYGIKLSCFVTVKEFRDIYRRVCAKKM